MHPEFEARKALGQLYDEHLEDDHGDFSRDLIIRGHQVAVFVYKFSPKSINLETHIGNIRYLYNYTGDPAKKFDIFSLEPLGGASNHFRRLKIASGFPLH